MAPRLQTLPQEIQLNIAKSLQDSYQDFELDKSMYSLAMTCRRFYQITEPLLYSRYSDEKQTITNVGRFIRTLISRPDLWQNVKFLSVTFSDGRSMRDLDIDKYLETFADAKSLQYILNPKPYTLEGLELERDLKVRKIANLVGDWERFTRVVRNPIQVFEMQSGWNNGLAGRSVNNYQTLLATILTLLSPGIQKLQLKRPISLGRAQRPTRLPRRPIFPQIFNTREPTLLRLLSLQEVHYTTAGRLTPAVEPIWAAQAARLDSFLRIPTLKSLKVDGFAFRSILKNWIDKPRSYALESLDLKYDFDVEFEKFKAFLSIFKGLKNFSYDGKIRDVVNPEFFRQMMEGLYANKESMESISLTSICRFKDDHSILEVSNNGFANFPRLKRMKMQMDLLIGVDDESPNFELKNILPKSLERLELWSQCKYESPDAEKHLLDLIRGRSAFPRLQELKIVYSTRYPISDSMVDNVKAICGEMGVEFVVVPMPGTKYWMAQMPLE